MTISSSAIPSGKPLPKTWPNANPETCFEKGSDPLWAGGYNKLASPQRVILDDQDRFRGGSDPFSKHVLGKLILGLRTLVVQMLGVGQSSIQEIGEPHGVITAHSQDALPQA